MNQPLIKRCALAMLIAMTFAIAMGLVAWGPMPLDDEIHRYADTRAWLGIPNAVNALANIPLLLMGAWGWVATGASRWPEPLRATWRGFHGFVMLVAIVAAAYHASPGHGLFTLAHTLMACAVVMLTCALLGERVSSAFASTAVRAGACASVLALGAAMLLGGHYGGSIDMRPLLLLEMVPLLLIPAGVLNLPGSLTRSVDWLVLLSGYAGTKLFALADGAILQASGLISGHTLMHFSLVVAAGWMAYRASAAPLDAVASATEAASQRETSSNTSSADAM